MILVAHVDSSICTYYHGWSQTNISSTIFTASVIGATSFFNKGGYGGNKKIGGRISPFKKLIQRSFFFFFFNFFAWFLIYLKKCSYLFDRRGMGGGSEGLNIFGGCSPPDQPFLSPLVSVSWKLDWCVHTPTPNFTNHPDINNKQGFTWKPAKNMNLIFSFGILLIIGKTVFIYCCCCCCYCLSQVWTLNQDFKNRN